MLAFCGIGGRGATPPAGHVARPSVMPGPPIRGGCGDQRSVLSSEAGPYPRPEPIADEVGTCSRGFYISAGTFRGLLAINQLFTQRVTRGVRVSADLSRIFSDHVPVLTMPRTYKCKSCGVVHQPPTGKHCPNRDNLEARQPEDQEDHVLPVLMKVQQRMDEMEKYMRQMSQDRNYETREPSPDEAHVEEGIQPDQESSSSDLDSGPATPETIRKDKLLMRKAARRLEKLRLRELDESEFDTQSTSKSAGKRSGSVLTATDKIVKTIDWPHLYVRRMVGGKRKGVLYADLKVEEFVYGFLVMISASKNKMDITSMLLLLQNLMQDAMEFSWANARAFYDIVGQDVEQGLMKWTDEQAIYQKRMTYARTIFPVRKEQQPTQKAPLTPAPPGTKCCTPYQRHTCEQDRDHHPYVHACAYCHKTKAVICRHPEDDCYRKTNDASKNVKQGGTGSPLPQ